MQTKYQVVYNVYAGGDNTSWAAITSPEQITLMDGTVKNFTVNTTLANPVGGPYYYPLQPGKTHFDQSMQGFMVSPRNLATLNYQFVMDGLVWGNYQVEAISTNFKSNQGAFARGTFECIFLDNGLQYPSIPFSGSQSSNYFNVAAADVSSSFAFNVGGGQLGVNYKNHRAGNETHFAREMDFGIIWWRTFGYDLTGHTDPFIVGQFTIDIVVSFRVQLYSPMARLIGPWIQAGCPITGSAEVTEIAFDSVTSGDTIISGGADEIVRKGKQSKWHLLVHKNDRGVVHVPRPLFGKRDQLKALRGKHLNSIDSLLGGFVTYPIIDLGISGVRLIKKILRSDAIVDGSKASGSGSFVAYSGEDSVYPQAMIAFKPSQQEPSQPIAKGILQSLAAVQSFGVQSILIQNVNVIACTHDGQSANADLPQISFGFDSDQGKATYPDFDKEVVSESLDINTLTGIISQNAILGAGKTYSKEGNGFYDIIKRGTLALLGAVTTTVQEISTNSNSSFRVSDISYEVPEHANFRAPIITTPEGSIKDLLTNYFSSWPSIPKYIVGSFDPSGISPDVNVIKANYRCNTAYGGVMGLIAGSEVNPVQGSMRNDMLTGLIASRFSPATHPQEFFETAILVTPCVEGYTSSQGRTVLERIVSSSGQIGVTLKTSDVQSEFTLLSHVGVIQTLTPTGFNFSVPWPSALPNIVGGVTVLEPLLVGTPVYFAVIRGTATEVSYQATVSFNNTLVFAPQLTTGCHDVNFTHSSPDVISTVTQGEQIENPPPYLFDIERSSTISGVVPSRSKPEE